jgi:hypothetical protein
MRLPQIPERWRGRRLTPALAIIGLVLVISLILINRSSDAGFDPAVRANPVVDLMGWLPATDLSRRAYAAWVEQPGAPLDLTSAIDRLAIAPAPLALGRSSEWQRATGISASQVTGWASAPGAGVTVLKGTFHATEIQSRLDQAGYRSTTYRSVPVWLSPDPVTSGRIIEGDDLRAANAIAVYQDRVVLGWDESSVHRALDAASGVSTSLATESAIDTADITTDLSGIMVVDQRDLAIECGVGGGWLKSDFTGPSGRTVAVLYHVDEVGSPVTSIWASYDDSETAAALLPILEANWRSGYANQIGLGGRVSDYATVQSLRQIDDWVVADLTAGRDNGWVRSGIRHLVAICEQASPLIPAGAPNRAAPVASPSPMEAP